MRFIATVVTRFVFQLCAADTGYERSTAAGTPPTLGDQMGGADRLALSTEVLSVEDAWLIRVRSDGVAISTAMTSL